MTIPLDRTAFFLRKAGPPTPLLAFLAGPHASAIAALWPPPHEGFLILRSARRHAAAILLARIAAESARDGATLVRWVMHERDGQLARRLAGDAAPGLMNALGKAGETLWATPDYQRLVALFAEPLANRVLRHMAALTPMNLGPLGVLPPALREAKVLAAVPGLAAAEDLARAWHIVGRMKGEAGQRRAAERWGRAQCQRDLFAMAAQDLTPEVFRPILPPPALPVPFEAVRTYERLTRVALDFQNCLRDFAVDIANGRMAIYVWHGGPAAAVALRWDAAGWRLAEVKARDNEDLPDGALRALVDALLAADVRTGPALARLVDRLFNHANGLMANEPPQGDATQALELGDLWA